MGFCHLQCGIYFYVSLISQLWELRDLGPGPHDMKVGNWTLKHFQASPNIIRNCFQNVIRHYLAVNHTINYAGFKRIRGHHWKLNQCRNGYCYTHKLEWTRVGSSSKFVEFIHTLAILPFFLPWLSRYSINLLALSKKSNKTINKITTSWNFWEQIYFGLISLLKFLQLLAPKLFFSEF